MIYKNVNKIKELCSLKNIKNSFSTVNTFALTNTENVVVRGINTVFQWQNIADKAIKGGLKFNQQKQEEIFNALDSGKETLVKTIKKTKNIFIKK